MAYKRKYGKKKTYRKKRMPMRRKTYRRKYRGGGSMGSITAGYLPIERTIKFQFQRIYLVTPTALNVPQISFYANNPAQPLVSNTSEWVLQGGAAGDSANGISEYVAKLTPPVGYTEKYRSASCYASNISVSAIPLQQSLASADTYADVAGLVLHKATDSISKEWPVTLTSNPDSALYTIGRMNFTQSKLTHTNPNGTPKGVKLSMGYSYKSMNSVRGPGAGGHNLFYQDNPPGEKDYFHICFARSVQDDAAPICPHLVTIKINYTCKLGEPNTSVQSSGEFYSTYNPKKRRRIQ